MGDLLMLTFEDDGPTNVWRDRSGRAFHAKASNSTPIAGRIGQGMAAAGGTYVPDYPEFFAPELTFESWIRPRASGVDGVVMGDGPNTLELEVSLINGAVKIKVSNGDPAVHAEAVCEELVPVPGTWTHVAVSWDGQTARFYGDSVLVCERPLEAQRAEAQGSRMYIGQSLDADLDEIKLSSYVKSQAQIESSMNFDSTDLIDRCGDGFVILSEPPCEPSALCCTSACNRQGEGETCQDELENTGVCDGSGLCVQAGSGRVGTEDLIALYTFAALESDIVRDQSGVPPIVDLRVVDLAAVEHRAGSLGITAPTALVADQGSDLVIDRMRSAAQFTVEAWVTPAATATSNLPRTLLSLSGTELNLSNATLGQAGTAYVMNARLHADGNERGEPASSTGLEQAIPAEVDHVVFTYGNNLARLYVNGQLIEQAPRPTGMNNWSSSFTLKLGNEIDAGGNLLGREWLGDLHLVALYHRALTPIEIASNYLAGANPELTASR